MAELNLKQIIDRLNAARLHSSTAEIQQMPKVCSASWVHVSNPEMRLHLSVTEKMNREHFGNWSLMWKADWANKIFAGYNRKTTC